jgi:DNA-binding MarR family transcriptional regulator
MKNPETGNSISEDVFRIQQCFPRIYISCHIQHERGKSNNTRLSSRDSTLLAHLSDDDHASPSHLAKHLNVTQATISEAVANLIDLGYIRATIDENDTRRQRLNLTAQGRHAISDSSVLDSEKLKMLLLSMHEDQRKQAVHGLQLLAQAALSLSRN